MNPIDPESSAGAYQEIFEGGVLEFFLKTLVNFKKIPLSEYASGIVTRALD